MRYLLNTGKSKTSVFLANKSVPLEPYENEGCYVVLNNNELADAQKSTTMFFDLRVVEESEIQKIQILNASKPVASLPVSQNSVKLVEKQTPNIVTLHNDKGDRVSAYNLELFNGKGMVIGTLSVQYNEDLDSLFVSTEGRDLKVLEKYSQKVVSQEKQPEAVEATLVDEKQPEATKTPSAPYDPVKAVLDKAVAKKNSK